MALASDRVRVCRKTIKLGVLFSHKSKEISVAKRRRATPRRSRKWSIIYYFFLSLIGSVSHFDAVWKGIRTAADLNKEKTRDKD